ncbi:MAG: ATP-binding cassette domain-containing protein [Verrucomicrobiota bacterium]
MVSLLKKAVRLEGVTKTYGRHVAVNNLSLEVPKGSIYGFIGPNGSGKTTTIRMILHILLADRGVIEVLGREGERAANDRIGYLPEERGLYKKQKVGPLLEYYGTLKGMSRKDSRREGKAWLEKLGLADWEHKRIEALSKGMAQKIQFISTVVSRPELIILDEPFSGLDPVNLEAIRASILELRKEGTTVIFSTHDMAMAEQMCDSIFMIYKGNKVLDGTLEQIQAEHGVGRLRIQTEGGVDDLFGIPGVELLQDLGRYQEVRASGDSNEFLKRLMEKTRVLHFEERRPSLHDIFVRIANPQEEELIDAK